MADQNAGYDQRVLETNLTKAGIALPKWEWQNTIQNPDGNNLDELCKKNKPKREQSQRGRRKPEDFDGSCSQTR